MRYALAASVPSLLLWGLGGLAFAWLLAKRAQLANYLRAGLKVKFYFWEVAVAGCKCCVVVLYFLGSRLSAFVQALLLVLLLTGMLLLQVKCAPYEEAALNRSELIGASVVLATAYAGLNFVSTESNTVVLVLLFGLHAGFALMWIFAACEMSLRRRLRTIAR
ncbi:MAG: hypothetical protein J0651_03400 [Actinobacteria bacterium]|nr:hypothetical protein [Actinomycetota bacterium]